MPTDNNCCPTCGKFDSRSMEFNLGQRAGKKIMESVGEDYRRQAAWMKFLAEFKKSAVMSTTEIMDFIDGAIEAVRAGKQ